MSGRGSRQPDRPQGEDPDLALVAAKRAVTLSLLGRDGVHGVGLRRDRRVIVVYAEPMDSAIRDRLRVRASELAAPFEVEVVESQRSGAGGGEGV